MMSLIFTRTLQSSNSIYLADEETEVKWRDKGYSAKNSVNYRPIPGSYRAKCYFYYMSFSKWAIQDPLWCVKTCRSEDGKDNILFEPQFYKKIWG